MHLVTHWLAGAVMPAPPSPEGAQDIAFFYAEHGVVVCSTVADGDCGIDACCMMVGAQRTAAERQMIRDEIYDYLVHSIRQPALQAMMVACQELTPADVPNYGPDARRSCGEADQTLDLTTEAPLAVAEGTVAGTQQVTDGALCAVKWATGVTDDAVALSVARGLAPAILQEQPALHQKFKEAPPAPNKKQRSSL